MTKQRGFNLQHAQSLVQCIKFAIHQVQQIFKLPCSTLKFTRPQIHNHEHTLPQTAIELVIKLMLIIQTVEAQEIQFEYD